MPLRVGFDGRALASPAAGGRRYTHELFGAIAAQDGVDVFAVGAPEAVALPAGVSRTPGARSLPGNAGWMLTGLPAASRALPLDLFHAPSYTAPLGGPRPLVLTVHDVSYARHPEWYPYRRDTLRRAFYRWSARSADRIVTDSAFSRDEIVAAYGVRSEQVDVVPLAANGGFAPGAGRDPVAVPYLLHVGDLHVRRNLATAVRALSALRRQRADLPPVRLVAVGVDRGAGLALRALAAAEHVELEMRGAIDDEELVGLYRGALALVYPSFYEGFGLPLVEAMACGTPVIAARAASIPEVVGDAALLIEPLDVSGWADAIAAVFDPGTEARLRTASRARAGIFTWRRAAALTVEIYQKALSAR